MTDIKGNLESVVDAIVKEADKEREESEPYKELFGEHGESIEGLLRKTEHEMTKIVLNMCHVLKEKYKCRVPDELFNIVLALPFVTNRLEKDIRDKEGMTYCVDKSYRLLSDIILKMGKGDFEF